MNNKELLIQILLELRSNGIKNNDLLKIIEKIPPHYYLNLFSQESTKTKIIFNELIVIAKLVELVLAFNRNLENVFISGFEKGWTLALFSNFAKRVYGSCSNLFQKNLLEDIFLRNNLKNIYLNKENNIKSWKKVAPFDLIITFKNTNDLDNIVSNLLSKAGIAIIPKLENNRVRLIRTNKNLNIFKTDLNFIDLNKSELL